MAVTIAVLLGGCAVPGTGGALSGQNTSGTLAEDSPSTGGALEKSRSVDISAEDSLSNSGSPTEDTPSSSGTPTEPHPADPSADDSPSISGTPTEPNPSGVSAEDTSSADTATSSVIKPPPKVENVEALDNTSIGWGIGKDRDENNCPLDCKKSQEKYAVYEVDFYKEKSHSIYLTFDEGYEAGYTGQILDTLKEHQVSAVFFITMQYAKEEPDLIQRMIEEGHILGNHSSSHPVNGMPSLSIEEQKKDIQALNDYVKEQYGYEMKLFRFPSGKFSEQSIAVVNNLGLKSVFWSFAHYDYNVNDQPDPAASLEKMKHALHPGAIYLLHAVSSTDTQILGDLIQAAEEAGCPAGRYDEPLSE